MNLTAEFKNDVVEALMTARPKFSGTDSAFAISCGLSAAIFSRLKKGDIDGVLSPAAWITLGRLLQVNRNKSSWKIVKTVVYREMEDSIKFCQENSRSMILVDESGIGKTMCAKHIVKNLRNAFYIDCSQAKTKQQFIRLLAKTVGVDNRGKYVEVKADLKYYLTIMEVPPVIVLDEAGDLEYTAFLEIKEIWNATEGHCGWYMIGADGLRSKIDKGIGSKKVGFTEIFSRFSDEYIKIVPTVKEEKVAFFKHELESIAQANAADKNEVKKLVMQCITKDKKMRHLETLIKMSA